MSRKILFSFVVTFLLLLHGTNGFSHPYRTVTPVSISVAKLQLNTSDEAYKGDESEIERLRGGWKLLSSGNAFDWSRINRMATLEDIIGFAGLLPLVFESLRTVYTGQLCAPGYIACAGTTLLTSIAHSKMTIDSPRDLRAPRLAEYRTVYEFSAFYLVPFAWLIWRITDAYPKVLEEADPIMSTLLPVITLYGFCYAFYGKKELDDANAKPTYNGNLKPSSPSYQAQAQLYLTGNIVINGLACLFIPFAWTLSFRGTEWWERTQSLHPNQGAFIGLSLLVATLGDVSGNFLLRLRDLDLIKSSEAIVVMGILSNFWLLLIPEIIFNSIYSGGISEIGFYFE